MKILAYTSPARGHLYPLVPVLDELVARGHQVAVRTLASQVATLAERGVAAAPISPVVEAIEHDDHRGRTPPARLRRAMATFNARAPDEVRDLRAAIADEHPEALLVDGMTWGAAAAAEAWGGPWAQWFPYPLPLSSKDVPPFGPGLAPARGPLGRARDRILRPLTAGALERAALPGLNETRAALGMRPFASADDLFTTAPLLLYMTAEPFEYPRSDWPSSVRSVGPCCWDPPGAAPAWLNELERPLWSARHPSSRTTGAWPLRRSRRSPTSPSPSSRHCRRPTGRPSSPRTPGSRPSFPTRRFSSAPCARSPTAARARPRRRSRRASRCASSRSGAISSRSRDASSRRRPAAAFRRGVSAPVACSTAVRRATTMREGARRVAEGFAAAGGPSAAADSLEGLASRPSARAAQ